MPGTWKNLFFYGGLTKEEYLSILPDINTQNQHDLKAYCTVVSLLLGISAVAVFCTSAFNLSTVFVYLLGLVCSLLLLFLSKYAKKYPRLEGSLKYVFLCVVYGFGILVTMAQPESLAVAFMVILVLAPLLFTVKPSVMAGYTLAAVIVFSICEITMKDASLVGVDISNAATYGVLSVLVGIIVQRMRLQNLTQLRKIAVLSESDLLTGLKNRNSFEQNPIVYGGHHIKDVTCVYGDVNGLHELNNTQGHKAGDLMLQTVAQIICNHFGRDHSYRVGGDEFVIFAFGQAPEETQRQIDAMNSECQQKGYHVSFGFACGNDSATNMDGLIKLAEARMYAAKEEYYRRNGIDHKRR